MDSALLPAALVGTAAHVRSGRLASAPDAPRVQRCASDDCHRVGPFVLSKRSLGPAPAGTGQPGDWHIAIEAPGAWHAGLPEVMVLRRCEATAALARFSGAPLHVVTDAAHFEQRWSRLSGTRALPITSWHGSLLLVASSGLHALWEDRAVYGEHALQRGIEAALDLIERAMPAPGPAQDRQDILFEQARQTIQRDLEDPALSPAGIARRHGCSLRSLQLAFAKHHTTITLEMRDQRLARCRTTLLAEPHEQIGRLALRWGFNDASHFCRLFKTAYGVSPRQYRRQGGSTGNLPHDPSTNRP